MIRKAQTCSALRIIAGVLVFAFSEHARPFDPARITAPVTFSAGDVASFPGVAPQIILNDPLGSAALPNDIRTLSQNAGFAVRSPAVSDLFVASPLPVPVPIGPFMLPAGTNVNIAGPGAQQFPNGLLGAPQLRAFTTLGLVPGDNINSVSFGLDGTGLPTQLLFSVDPDALGAVGTTVRGRAVANKAAGDVFATGEFPRFSIYQGTPLAPALNNRGSNISVATGAEFGLTTDKILPKQSRPGFFEDDLNALEVADPFGPRFAGRFFFTLDQFSPTAQVGSVFPFCGPSFGSLACPSDILVSAGAGGVGIYASHGLLGLNATDIIDALALADLGVPGVRDSGDMALFSLAPGSAFLDVFDANLNRFLSAADVFITSFSGDFSVYARAEALGLLQTDNLNALDTVPVTAAPEPGTLLLVALAVIVFLFISRRQDRDSRRTRQTACFPKRQAATIAATPALLLLGLVSGANAQIQIPSAATCENNPSVAVDPVTGKVLVGFNTASPAIGSSGIAGALPFPGAFVAPAPGVIPLPLPFVSGGEPSVAFNSAGQAFYGMVDRGNRSIFAARNVQGGPAGIPVPVAVSLDPGVKLDRENIAIDLVSPLRFPNGTLDNIYVAFSRQGHGRKDIYFSRSTDLGRLYSRGIPISDTFVAANAGFYRQSAVPAAANGNKAYVAWTEAPTAAGGDGAIMFQASTDGGRSFPIPPLIASFADVHPHLGRVRGSGATTATAPTLAVDNTAGPNANNVYIAWANKDPFAKDLNICFTKSPGGPPFDFAPRVRINTLEQTVATDQFHPWMAVNSLGHIAVVYFSKVANGDDRATVSAVCSPDGGTTWTPDFVVSADEVRLDLASTQQPDGMLRIGERLGLAASGANFIASWPSPVLEAGGGVCGINPNIRSDIFIASFVCPAAPTFPPPVCEPDVPRFRFVKSRDQVIPITTNSQVAAAAMISSGEIIQVALTDPSLTRSVPLPRDPVTDVVITPDNQTAVVADADAFYVLDLTNGTLRQLPLPKSPLSEISVTPDSQRALIALSSALFGGDPGPDLVAVVDLVRATLVSVPLSAPPRSGITITPDGQKALVATGLGVDVIDVQSATRVTAALAQEPDTGVVLMPDGTRALVAAGATLYVLDIASGTVLFDRPLPSPSLTDITVTPDGARAVLGTTITGLSSPQLVVGGAVTIANLVAPGVLNVALPELEITGLDVTPDSTQAVIRTGVGAHIINLVTGDHVIVPLPPALPPVTNPVVTPDGTRAVFGDAFNVNIVRLGAAPALERTKFIGEAPVVSLAVTPDSRQAVFGTATRMVVVELTTAAPPVDRPLGGAPARTGASISPDGQRATLLTDKGMEVLRLDTLTTVFFDRSPRSPMLNSFPDDGQPALPPFGERGRRTVLDGR